MIRRIFAKFGWALMPVQDARDLHWMARRYADGRQTFAPLTFNRLTRPLLAAGVIRPSEQQPDETVWARDGSGKRSCDGLTDAKAAAGADWINRNQRMIEQEWRRVEQQGYERGRADESDAVSACLV